VTAVPVAIRVTRYACPLCHRSHGKKAACTAHIARCWLNPDARACKTCIHYTPSEAGPYPEHPGWDEQCGLDIDLSSGLKVGCPAWEAPDA
jgi:hypothetical protein